MGVGRRLKKSFRNPKPLIFHALQLTFILYHFRTSLCLFYGFSHALSDPSDNAKNHPSPT